MYRDGLGYGLWCLWLVGLGGVHRIYLGKYGTGILWLLTYGLFGIGQFVDLFRMKRLVEEANIREGYLPHPRLGYGSPGEESVPARSGGSGGHGRKSNELQLLEAAEKHGGSISVTQGVAATGLSFEEVEETLGEMLTTGYVDVDNAPDSGVVIYRFTELR